MPKIPFFSISILEGIAHIHINTRDIRYSKMISGIIDYNIRSQSGLSN